MRVDSPDGEARGALIAHPHPLFGGTLDNKVVQTLARALLELGYETWRPNFRGVGRPRACTTRAAASWKISRRAEGHPESKFVLAGFSFGASRCRRTPGAARPPEWLVLVGVGGHAFEAPPVPAGTLVIHGENDDTVPLAAVLDWARPQELPVVVVPGADHFFHRKLHILRALGPGKLAMSALSARALRKSYGALEVVSASTSASPRASASACSARTAPARPPRSSCASA
jgi:alpha/beta superfamily hydrolase